MDIFRPIAPRGNAPERGNERNERASERHVCSLSQWRFCSITARMQAWSLAEKRITLGQCQFVYGTWLERKGCSERLVLRRHVYANQRIHKESKRWRSKTTTKGQRSASGNVGTRHKAQCGW